MFVEEDKYEQVLIQGSKVDKEWKFQANFHVLLLLYIERIDIA